MPRAKVARLSGAYAQNQRHRRPLVYTGSPEPSSTALGLLGNMPAELGPRAIGAPDRGPPDSRPAGVPTGSARSLPALGASQRSRSSNTVKTAGTMIKVSKVEVTKPPMTAMAIGDRKSLSPAKPMATGSMPATMATVVMTMGRARLWPDSMIASNRDFPARISSIAKSTNRMEFLATIPINMRYPMTTEIEKGRLVSSSARAAPPNDSGSADNIVMG